MQSRLVEIFEDSSIKERIRRKLPHLFTIAELESSRAGKVGMEVDPVSGKLKHMELLLL